MSAISPASEQSYMVRDTTLIRDVTTAHSMHHNDRLICVYCEKKAEHQLHGALHPELVTANGCSTCSTALIRGNKAISFCENRSV